MKPWFMYPTKTLKVLNRLASRLSYEELHAKLDILTDRLYFKCVEYSTHHPA